MKISSFEMIALLLLSRIFTLMIYSPIFSFPTSVQLVGIALSTIFQGALALFLIVLMKKTGYKSYDEVLFKNKVAGCIFSAVYCLFFILSGAAVLSSFIAFARDIFFPEQSFLAFALPIAAVCIYGAILGIKPLGRSAGLIFFIFILMFAVTVLSSSERLSSVGTYGGEFTARGVLLSAVYDMSRSLEFVMLPFIAVFSKNIRKDYFGFLASRLVILETAVFLIGSVLKEYIDYTKFPFFTLGGAVGGFIRLDALYLVMWTFCAVVKISLIIFFSGDIVKKFLPRKNYRFILSGIAVMLFSFCGVFMKNSEISAIIYAVLTLILGGIVPIIIYSREVHSYDKKTSSDNADNFSADRV